MTFPIDNRMQEILALTRSGQLGAATALIHNSLGAGTSHSGPADAAGPEPFVNLRAQQTGLPAPSRPRSAPARDTARPDADRPASGSFTRHSFHSDRGSLDYLLYIPATAGEAMPLVVMLHGCTQSAEDFARGTQMNQLAEEFGLLVAYPEQTRGANPQKCWNWFRPGDQAKGSGEPALIAGITSEIAAGHSVDPARIYVAGLSAGGAAAAIMAQAYPDIFAAAGIHSGLACGSAVDLPGALSAMKGMGRQRSADGLPYVPLITFHGDRDNTVAPANSDQIHNAWRGSSAMTSLAQEVETGVSPGGRKYRRTALRNAAGASMAESWLVMGAGHAWSGGSPSGTYTDAAGPNASREMLRFFLQHRIARPAAAS